MYRLYPAIIASAALLFSSLGRAAEEFGQIPHFFIIKASELAKLAPTDEALDTVSMRALTETSIATGSYIGNGYFTFQSEGFGVQARFARSAEQNHQGPAAIEYNISARNAPGVWIFANQHDVAIKQGKHFIAKDWRNQEVVVLFRFTVPTF